MPVESKTCCGCKLSQNASLQPESQTKSDAQAELSHLSVFDVPKMDCPSEENLIRTAFAALDIEIVFKFDIPNRRVHIFHPDMADKVDETIGSVGLGATLVSFESVDRDTVQATREATKLNETREAQALRWLLAINASMFVLELCVGIVAQSTGLIADSLDMFADAAVYGVSLYAVGKAARLKLKAAHLAGWLQLALALGVLIEVLRRGIFGSEPVSILMMGMGTIALLANIVCLLLIFKSRNQGAHMKASWIFSANDVLANAGVIIAGTLVALTGSQIPDLIIGVIIGFIVLNGARRILLLR